MRSMKVILCILISAFLVISGLSGCIDEPKDGLEMKRIIGSVLSYEETEGGLLLMICDSVSDAHWNVLVSDSTLYAEDMEERVREHEENLYVYAHCEYMKLSHNNIYPAVIIYPGADGEMYS